MESLTVYSECRDAIHRMINHPLWHDVLMKGDKIRITSLYRNFNPPQGWLLIAHALHKLNVFCFCRDWEIQEERGKMKVERGKRKDVIPPSLIRRGMDSLTEDSEGRDAIHRMINHPLWYDAGVTPVLLLDISYLSSLIFYLSSAIFHLSNRPKFVEMGRCNSLNVKRKLTFIKNLKNFIKKFAQYRFRPYLCTRSFKVHLG